MATIPPIKIVIWGMVYYLIRGFNPPEKYARQIGSSSKLMGKIPNSCSKCSKPPTSYCIVLTTLYDTMWAPPVISWFTNPINYSYKYHKP